MLFSTLLLSSMLNATPSAATCGVQAPAKVQPGQLIILRAQPQTWLKAQGRLLKQAPNGAAVFGISRDAASPVQIQVKAANGCQAIVKISVTKRVYKVEKVNGVPQNTVTPDPKTQARIAQEQALIQQARSVESSRLDWLASFQWPAKGRISGVYGSQRVINGTPLSPHLALDIALPTGTPFVATLPGKVSLAHEDMVLTGKTLVIDHGFGINSVYIHMSRLDVKTGDEVKAGQTLGAIGATGRASGPHLHFQVQWFQEKLDPALLMPRLY